MATSLSSRRPRLMQRIGDSAGAGAEFEHETFRIGRQPARHGSGELRRTGRDRAGALRVGEPFAQENRRVAQRGNEIFGHEMFGCPTKIYWPEDNPGARTAAKLLFWRHWLFLGGFTGAEISSSFLRAAARRVVQSSQLCSQASPVNFFCAVGQSASSASNSCFASARSCHCR